MRGARFGPLQNDAQCDHGERTPSHIGAPRTTLT